MRYPRTLTDKVVEDEVPKGGEFRILRDQCTPTQGPGGVDIVSRTKEGRTNLIMVPRIDLIPQTEGPEQVIWGRR